MLFTKRNFIKTLGLSAMSTIPVFRQRTNEYSFTRALDPELVEAFVNVAHSDLSQVQKMLKETPHLLNATQDWGDGDFESAIGAAGHMGNKDMANYLISLGCRYDIFVLTMLGKTTIVKSWLELYPDILHSIGPHGFTLLHHAKKGGEDASELYDHISNLGLEETFIPTFKKE